MIVFTAVCFVVVTYAVARFLVDRIADRRARARARDAARRERRYQAWRDVYGESQ